MMSKKESSWTLNFTKNDRVCNVVEEKEKERERERMRENVCAVCVKKRRGEGGWM